MAVMQKVFPFTEVLTIISGRMLAKRNTTDMLFDFAEFMLNDNHFCQDARSGAPFLTMQHFIDVINECVAEVKRQHPDIENYPIPEKFDVTGNTTNISFEYWQYVTDATNDGLLVTSLDRY